MERRTMFLLLGALLVTGVAVVVWLVWFPPRGYYTAPDCQSGSMAFGDTIVQYVSHRDGLLVVVWSDFSQKDQRTGGFGGSNGTTTEFSGSSGWTELHSSVKAGEGKAVELKARTTDGKAWTVTVNGKEYRLEDGGLILVRTRGASAKVSQLKQELSGLLPTNETWQKFAKESPEVKEFMAQAAAKE
jgi:hypothetical protein